MREHGSRPNVGTISKPNPYRLVASTVDDFRQLLDARCAGNNR
jgi:hypothetical protein